jgi:cytochrome c
MIESPTGKKRVVRRVPRHVADMPPAWAGAGPECKALKRRWRPCFAKRIATLAVFATLAFPAFAQDVMRGHGGPVRALAINGAARELVSGSFDSTVIVWDLDRGIAKRVLRFHEGPVNAVAILGDGCIASGGEDRRIAIWCGDGTKPVQVLEGHEAPVTSLASWGTGVASGSLDNTLRVWDHTGNLPSGVLSTFKSAVSSVSTLQSDKQDGSWLAGGTADGTVETRWRDRIYRISLVATISMIAASEDETIVASADGAVRFLKAQVTTAVLDIDGTPLSSLALSPDGRLIATAGLRGGIAIIDRASRKIIHRLTGPGLPVWSLVFDTDNRTLISGGADRVIRRWDAVEGKALASNLPERDLVAEAVASGERGAQIFRACQACHTLSSDDGNRAGPTLHGIIGRRIGSAPGYAYSEALPKLPIIWTSETIARLFEVGPNAYTPGTKMPEQTITDPADRHALVEWLARVTARQ